MARALGEGRDPQRAERLVGGPQLGAGVDGAPLPPQPLAVEQLGAGEFDADGGATESVEGLQVESLGGGPPAQQGAPARLDPEGPIRSAGPRHRRELLHRSEERRVGNGGRIWCVSSPYINTS